MKCITSFMTAAAAILYFSSPATAQTPFPAPRAAVNGTTGQLLDVQDIPSCAYVNTNGTTGTPLLLNLFGIQNASAALNSTSPPSWEVCYVWDPLRSEAPWSNSSYAYPQSFNPDTHVCTVTNYLCSIDAPYACGRQCFTDTNFTCVINQNELFGSYLVPAISNCTEGPFTVPPPPPTTTPTPSYPSIFVALVPTGSDIASSPVSVPATPAPTPATPATAAPLVVPAAATTAPSAALPTPAPTVPVGPTQAPSGVVPVFQPIGTPAPTAPASNRLLHRLSRFF